MKFDATKCRDCDNWEPQYETPGFEIGHCKFGVKTSGDQRCLYAFDKRVLHGLLVYVSSPYTQGDVGANVHVQLEAAHRIMDAGHIPLWPLSSHYLHVHRPRQYDDWMNMDLVLVDRCDVLLRLTGDSPGGDREVQRAIAQGKVVLYGWHEFNLWVALVNEQNGDPTSVDGNSIQQQITGTSCSPKE